VPPRRARGSPLPSPLLPPPLTLWLTPPPPNPHRLGAHYDIEGVADSAVLVLAKFTNTLNPSIPKPRVAFGRDPKACAAVEAMLLLVNR